MTLTFTQENGLYVAEFEATAPFSIHLERPRGGFINMLQRSVDSGTFVAVKNFNPNYNATQVIDADCGQGAVYPKWIRLESAVEPSVAEVTFESESSGGGAGTEQLYFAYSEDKGEAITLFNLVKLLHNGEMLIMTPITAYATFGDELAAKIKAFSVLPYDEVSVDGQRLVAIKDILPEMLSWQAITKEQFYSLEA